MTLELWQAEWCPYSHRVRRRLTELGVEFIARPVPARKGHRDAMADQLGTRSIPTLVCAGEVVTGTDEILQWLDATYPEPAGVDDHRYKEKRDWELWQSMEREFLGL
jgi:glutathione S-transferase